ncbi:MAG: helix-turn-helix domain-containing protein, partial [Actinomycetota bacterium]|nr:helix-turn-helix domain-containing protein [Actinomycetota bacterium]
MAPGKRRLVAVLDQRRVPRRRPNAPKLPKRLRERILKDYVAGAITEEVARRHGVSPQTVSNIAVRHGVARNPLRSPEGVKGRVDVVHGEWRR